jgi:hypothetical protein
MKVNSYKYRLVAWFAEISPKATELEAKAKAVLMTGLSESSFKRKMYAKLSDDGPKYSFKPGHLIAIKNVLNEYRAEGLPPITIEHLVNPAIEQQPAA